MEDIIDYISKNYKWIFSGIGVFVIALFLKNKASSSNKVNQKNIIAGRDVIGRDKKQK